MTISPAPSRLHAPPKREARAPRPSPSRPPWPSRFHSTEVQSVTVGLRIYGAVRRETVLGWPELAGRTMADVLGTLAVCRTGRKRSRVWSGAALQPILEACAPDAAANMLVAHGEGGYSIELELDRVLSGPTVIAFSVDGRPLSRSEGGPLRLVMPHLDAWRCAKWLRGLELRIDPDAPSTSQSGRRESIPAPEDARDSRPSA